MSEVEWPVLDSVESVPPLVFPESGAFQDGLKYSERIKYWGITRGKSSSDGCVWDYLLVDWSGHLGLQVPHKALGYRWCNTERPMELQQQQIQFQKHHRHPAIGIVGRIAGLTIVPNMEALVQVVVHSNTRKWLPRALNGPSVEEQDPPEFFDYGGSQVAFDGHMGMVSVKRNLRAEDLDPNVLYVSSKQQTEVCKEVIVLKLSLLR
jgi:hypothetical protein